MAEVRLDYGANGCSEHLIWCRFFELLVTFDQLDPAALVCCELGARRVQMIHDRWKHKSPEIGLGSTGAAGADDDSHLLLGISEIRGNLGVAPALQKWMGDEFAKEALATKERRKAREERALAAKTGRDPKGGRS